MSKEMLSNLKQELQETKWSLLSDICDLCRYPVELSSDALDEKCDECSMYQAVEDLLMKQRTVMTGNVMQIVAEEMHPVKKGDS